MPYGVRCLVGVAVSVMHGHMFCMHDPHIKGSIYGGTYKARDSHHSLLGCASHAKRRWHSGVVMKEELTIEVLTNALRIRSLPKMHGSKRKKGESTYYRE